MIILIQRVALIVSDVFSGRAMLNKRFMLSRRVRISKRARVILGEMRSRMSMFP
jgi:hypothetical protein